MMYQNLSRKDRIARKEHRCDWCNETINKGEKYYYETFIYDGEMCDWKSHLSCERIVSAIWDYIDPDEGMSADEFSEGCADVCREFICPDCPEWNKEYSECEKDESYCLDRIDKFFETHEMYAAREGYYRIWRCRELRGDSDEVN